MGSKGRSFKFTETKPKQGDKQMNRVTVKFRQEWSKDKQLFTKPNPDLESMNSDFHCYADRCASKETREVVAKTIKGIEWAVFINILEFEKLEAVNLFRKRLDIIKREKPHLFLTYKIEKDICKGFEEAMEIILSPGVEIEGVVKVTEQPRP